MSAPLAALPPGPEAIESGPLTLTGVDGAAVEAFHARPEGMPVSGIVVHPDIGGLRPLFFELAERLASHGFAVVAVEPFARIDPDERAGLDLDARMERVVGLVDEHQLGDLAAAADSLVVADGVTEVAVIGFCIGGMYALKAAGTDRFDRAVAFYGMIRVPERWRTPDLAEPLDSAPTACPTLAILGGNDPYTPPEDVEALRAAWAERPDCEIACYPDAEHGFVHDASRPAHRPEDAADAWSRALAFLTAE